MFLGDIVFSNGEYDDYELFHNIVSDFKYNHYLTILNIKIEDEKLKYGFKTSEGNFILVSFSGGQNFAKVTLQLDGVTFDEFSKIYKDLEKISQKHFSEKEETEVF